jgi:hypothetical protein
MVVQNSPFFKIPLELRNEIYAGVIASPDPIHVMPVIADDDFRVNQFLFHICTVDLKQSSGQCDCESIVHTTSARSVDTSLLSVSEQIRTEALTVLFERNHFHLDSELKLT